MTASVRSLLSGLVGFCLLSSASAGARVATVPAPGIQFASDLQASLEAARASGKPVAVSFVAAWCPICRYMKRQVFTDPELTALADRFHWVTVDIDRDLSTALEYRVDGVPAIYVMDPDGALRIEFVGLHEADELAARLTAFVDGADRLQPPGTIERSGSVEQRPAAPLTWRPKGYRGSGICFSHVGYGPLNLYSHSPFQSLRMGIRPRTPSTLAHGQYEVAATATWVNLWGVDTGPLEADNDFLIDLEMLQTSLVLSYGLSDTLEIEGEVQNRSRFGGIMDGLTQGFHDLVGIDQNGRDEIPQDQFTLFLSPPAGPEVRLGRGDRGDFSRTVQLSLQHNVTCGSRRFPAFSYSVTARVETLDRDSRRGGDVDYGASVALARRVGRFHLYWTVGYAWFAEADFRDLELDDEQFTGMIAGEWRFAPRMSLTLQWLRSDGLIDGFGPFGSHSNEVTLGYKWELRDRGILELGAIENIGEFDNSPDFGLHVGFSQRF